MRSFALHWVRRVGEHKVELPYAGPAEVGEHKVELPYAGPAV